jgi:hypothetical protein
MVRLTIDMTNQKYHALKAMAALEGKTIKRFALERLFPADSSGSEALEPMKALLAERVAQAQRGELADGSVMEIAERAVQSSGK